MSAIDCSDVVHVANYYDIATYWPIQEQDRDAVTGVPHDKGKLITSNDIVIGGGSGEHPAMVINIDYAISTMASVCDGEYFGINGFVDISPWGVLDLHSLYNKMKIDEVGFAFDVSILLNIAALVIFELPLEKCIINPKVLQYAQNKRKEKPWEFFDGFTAVFNSCKWGRIVGADNVLKWGYSLEDWYNDNGGRK